MTKHLFGDVFLLHAVAAVVVCDGDCADLFPGINPGAAEDCRDGLDNDCDGNIDEPGFIALVAGRDLHCALSCYGEPHCWGDSGMGATNPPVL